MKKYQPMYFPQHMLNSVLNGSKIQIRKPIYDYNRRQTVDVNVTTSINNDSKIFHFTLNGDSESMYDLVPPFKEGEIIYLLERFAYDGDDNYIYALDNKSVPMYNSWYDPFYLPRKGARLFVKITSVRVERLAEITEEDCFKEGMEMFGPFRSYMTPEQQASYDPKLFKKLNHVAKDAFLTEWDRTIPRTENFCKNMFVWVYEFELVEKPQDF